MTIPRAHDDQLARVKELRAQPETISIEADLAALLDSRFPMVVSSVAELTAARNYTACRPKLVAAFQRFLEKPTTTDKGCLAKTALATALYNLNFDSPALFLRHLHYVQIEPVFGGSVDTAAELRGRCIMALAKLEYPDTLLQAVPLLVDPLVPARIGAVRALNMLATPAAIALLRLRALDGEHDAEVLGEILIALLEIDAPANLPFVGAFLDSPSPAFVEAAALALGSARRPEAVAYLTGSWNHHPDPRVQQATLLAIGMTRTDAGLKFLLAHVEKAPAPEARAALTALAIYRHDDRVAGQLMRIVEQRKQPTLTAHYRQEFRD